MAKPQQDRDSNGSRQFKAILQLTWNKRDCRYQMRDNKLTNVDDFCCRYTADAVPKSMASK